MDKEPINSQVETPDIRFADIIADWSHIAEQVNDQLHEGENHVNAADIRQTLGLIGVTLRTCTGPELLAIFSMLDIDLQALLVEETDSIEELFNHEHGLFERITDPVHDEMPTWKVRCRKCGTKRRVVVVDE